ncbi:MAG TPA: copper-binding protein [Caulobacteraceae bacterium]
MLKRLIPLLMMGLMAATAAHAQYGGGHGGGGRGRQPSGGSSDRPAAASKPAAAPKPPKPMNQVEIVGVVDAVDAGAKRVTITYDAVDELNWPHGTTQFAVYQADLLKAVKVGERVRFKLDSMQITDLAPY